ncbi:3-hydroxyacyl-CoA dehydrogenase family protein [Arthrobacter sp. ISL-28]|uniref:3-hydroxyacyl-CoA dehydrogenase family protein n=1 Tax=Arthrobacter sp. ISL-28 TaxID=2819108 RepID=UPI001BEC0B7C|nr:3-hydroxybutyryl-CoA dehydrogenase [Arthrobacter sp. ISL-28]MBT2523359.1 3-hydroxybutyryl-CoA dehydrogenase [Arthrobacter sp. ISL-28]
MSNSIRRIGKIGVAGSGAMGRGIAESCLRAGASVLLQDTSAAALRAARKQIERSLQHSVDKGIVEAKNIEAWLSQLEVSEDVAAFMSCDLVIEAVPEIPDLKLEVLKRIEKNVRDVTIIATNTSSIPVTKLSSSLMDPSRFLGLHFFNPVPRMNLAEVIPTVLTDSTVTAAVEYFVREQLEKTPLTVADRPGFAVNALLIPYLLSAARMLDLSYASADDIDNAMKLGCGHPMGPLELSDFIGLDVVAAVAGSIYAETKDHACIVPNNLRRLVEAGQTGRKSGQGFFKYADNVPTTSGPQST